MLKKVIIGLQVVILVVMFFLLYKVYQPAAPATYVFDDKGKQVSKVTDSDIIVYYDYDSLMKQSNFIDSIQTQLHLSEQRYQKSLEAAKNDYMNWMNQIQGKIARKEITVVEQQQVEQQDYDKQMQLQQLQATAQNDMAVKGEKSMKLINDAILKTVKELNVRKNIKFVLAYGGASQIVMPTQSSLNVTSDMLEIINNLYKTKRK